MNQRDFYQASGTFDYKFDNGMTLSYIPSWVYVRLNEATPQNGNDPATSDNLLAFEPATQYTQELRLSGDKMCIRDSPTRALLSGVHVFGPDRRCRKALQSPSWQQGREKARSYHLDPPILSSNCLYSFARHSRRIAPITRSQTTLRFCRAIGDVIGNRVIGRRPVPQFPKTGHRIRFEHRRRDANRRLVPSAPTARRSQTATRHEAVA